MSELKRRNVLRMAVLYAVAAWVILQVAEVLIELAKLPDWIGTTTLWLLAVGFPIALIFSWFYEITSEGISLEKDVDRAESITHVTGRRLDFIVISLLCAAVILFAYDKWWMDGQPQQSIAVLPFVNMSDDASNEYFSDGISEELLNLLTKIPELRVISRSSAFSYKGKGIDIPTIAAQLNVTHVLEGSVRKAGNRVRITAQLIEARTDTHLWSETYDRSLDNIFAIQDEIATAVVEQLKVVLLHDAPIARETNPEAYALYLQGRHLRRQNTARSLEQAQTLLQQALASDPGYAAAWDELSSVYISQGSIGLRPIDETRTLSREAVSKALVIDAGFALAHANLGWIVRGSDFDLSAAAQHFERALQLEPANTDIIRRAASLTASLGRLDEAIALNEFVIARDPISHSGYHNRGLYYLYAGRWDEAIASIRIALTLSPGYGGAQYRIGVALLFKGEPQAALDAMRLEDSVWGMVGLPMAYHALGRAGESDAALAELIEQHEQGWAYNIAYVFAYRRETGRAFEWLDRAVEYKDAGLSNILSERLFSDIQDDPRWLVFLESIGKSPEQLAAIEFKVTLPE
ncbi:MAG: tetratricopeptide repeat protein [Proteobacteria bacterium]|nr:tetratricopeptide repeat protein [Pseudomonadota bacterium]